MAEILTQPERRRRWTSEQKLALVAEMLRPGASPTQVARRYGISTGLLYTWRQLARSGELALVPMAPPAPAFVPVEIVPEAPIQHEDATGVGIMVIELPGNRRVHVDRDVDADALRRVLMALGAAP
jgi:transposase